MSFRRKGRLVSKTVQMGRSSEEKVDWYQKQCKGRSSEQKVAWYQKQCRGGSSEEKVN
jgi:hypothetical protein